MTFKNSKIYDFLKWFSLVAAGALSLFYGVVADAWGLPYKDPICTTVVALGVLVGTLIGVSGNAYKKTVEPTEYEPMLCDTEAE